VNGRRLRSLIPRTRQEIENKFLWSGHIFDLCEVIICQELTQSQDALRRYLLSEQVFETIMIRTNLEGHPKENCAPSGERHLCAASASTFLSIISVLRSSQLPRHESHRTRFRLTWLPLQENCAHRISTSINVNGCLKRVIKVMQDMCRRERCFDHAKSCFTLHCPR